MGRKHDWLVPAALICICSLIAAAVLTSATGYPTGLRVGARFSLCAVVVALAATFRFGRYTFRLWRSGVENPLANVRADWRSAAVDFMPIVAGVCIIGLFIQAMSQIKPMIPETVPFWADPYLLAFDQAVIGDTAIAARAVQSVMPALDWFYFAWHAVNLGGILWVLHWRQPARGRLVLTYLLTWAIGMALAFAGSSAGPIFTGHFPRELAPDMVQRTSAALWHQHEQGAAVLGGGISAFPSMHVAIAVWFAIALHQRGLGVLGTFYVAGVLICSVLLGWHYSLDGVAGVGVALVAWKLAGKLHGFRLPAAVPILNRT